MWKKNENVYRIFFFLLQIQEKKFFSRESPTNLRICYRSSDFFFFFRTQKKEKNLENFEHIWGFFFFLKLSEKKKIPLFFPLHALNWNFMFKMKWKKVSHKKKKTFSHFRKKKLLCRQKSHGYGFQTWENNPTVWQNTWLCSLRVDPLTSCPVGLLSERPLSCGFGTRRDGRLQSPAGRRHRTGFHADPWEKKKNINSLIINTPVCTFLWENDLKLSLNTWRRTVPSD